MSSICKTCNGEGWWKLRHRDHYMDFNVWSISYCPDCILGKVLAENARLRRRVNELLGQRNGWAEKSHADWCCGPGDLCCCGHEAVKKGDLVGEEIRDDPDLVGMWGCR